MKTKQKPRTFPCLCRLALCHSCPSSFSKAFTYASDQREVEAYSLPVPIGSCILPWACVWPSTFLCIYGCFWMSWFPKETLSSFCSQVLGGLFYVSIMPYYPITTKMWLPIALFEPIFSPFTFKYSSHTLSDTSLTIERRNSFLNYVILCRIHT